MIQPTNQQLYPQQGGANAVSINIYNPQAYGNTPNGPQVQTPPYDYTNSLYQMPQASNYDQTMQPEAYQQYIPQQTPQVMQNPIQPAPQVMPDTVMDNNQQAVEQNPQPVDQNVQSPEVVNNEPQNTQTVNVDELTQQLADPDLDKKAEVINKIAEYAQAEPEVALQVVSEPVIAGLTNIINEDTSVLEGPTEEQIAVAEKIAKGEQLTPEEDALSEQLSPRDKANKNRIFALFTLAMIQKLQRDELNQYIENQKANGEQPIEPLKIEELEGYNDIVHVIQNDPRPEVKVGALQALQYIAEPQDKEAVQAVLANVVNSEDEAVKAAAQEIMAQFDAVDAQAAPEAEQQVETQPAQENVEAEQPQEQPAEEQQEQTEEQK